MSSTGPSARTLATTQGNQLAHLGLLSSAASRTRSLVPEPEVSRSVQHLNAQVALPPRNRPAHPAGRSAKLSFPDTIQLRSRVRRGHFCHRRPECPPFPPGRGSRGRPPQCLGLVRRRPPSDHDALDLVNGHRVRRPIVELRRLRRRVPGDLLRVLQCPPVREVRRDPRRPERVAAR